MFLPASQSRQQFLQFRELLLGIALLTCGVLVYAIARQPSSLWLISGGTGPSAWWLPLAGQLPTFLHASAFSLISASFLPAERRMNAAVCTFWFGVNALFETAQHASLGVPLAAFLPAAEPGTLLDHTRGFFSAGTFDPADVLAAAAGAGLAFLLLERLPRRTT